MLGFASGCVEVLALLCGLLLTSRICSLGDDLINRDCYVPLELSVVLFRCGVCLCD